MREVRIETKERNLPKDFISRLPPYNKVKKEDGNTAKQNSREQEAYGNVCENTKKERSGEVGIIN